MSAKSLVFREYRRWKYLRIGTKGTTDYAIGVLLWFSFKFAVGNNENGLLGSFWSNGQHYTLKTVGSSWFCKEPLWFHREPNWFFHQKAFYTSSLRSQFQIESSVGFHEYQIWFWHKTLWFNSFISHIAILWRSNGK